MADIGAILAEFGARLRKLEGRERMSVSPIASVATSQTLKASNQTTLVNATGGTVTLTLPAAAGARYVVITVKKTDASANAVVIDGNGAETIDGAATRTLSGQYDAVTLWCSGTTWIVIASCPCSATTALTVAYRSIAGIDSVLLMSDTLVGCTGTLIITLPTAVGVAGKIFEVKNSGTGIITVATTGGQTIDDAADVTIDVQYDALMMASNGSNWIII